MIQKMKNMNITAFLTGLSVAAMLIGLALFGLTLGNSLSSGIAMREHMLFLPAIVCMGAGVLNLMPIFLSDASKSKNEN